MSTIDEQLAFFQKNGYLVVPNALLADKVGLINQAIDRDLRQNKVMWQERG